MNELKAQSSVASPAFPSSRGHADVQPTTCSLTFRPSGHAGTIRQAMAPALVRAASTVRRWHSHREPQPPSRSHWLWPAVAMAFLNQPEVKEIADRICEDQGVGRERRAPAGTARTVPGQRRRARSRQAPRRRRGVDAPRGQAVSSRLRRRLARSDEVDPLGVQVRELRIRIRAAAQLSPELRRPKLRALGAELDALEHAVADTIGPQDLRAGLRTGSLSLARRAPRRLRADGAFARRSGWRACPSPIWPGRGSRYRSS